MQSHKNQSLNKAKKQRNDEFYTTLEDIARLFDSADVGLFKGKSLLLPCDDYRYSRFYTYFKGRFAELGLSRLVSVAYQEHGHGILCRYDGKTEEVRELHGNGDFRLEASQREIKAADMVITNPPYSLIGELFSCLMAHRKQFLLIAPVNSLHYVEIFPFIRSGEIQTSHFDIRRFIQPDNTLATPARSVWMGNLMNFEKPMLQCTYSLRDYDYREYDNIRALEIPYARMIPHDYKGLMGVPSTFLSKINLQQFDLLVLDSEIYRLLPEYMKTWDVPHRKDKPYVNGKMCYSRIFVRHKISQTGT